MLNNFMSNHDGFPVSRDWQEIVCARISCLNNRDGRCCIPALATIDSEGKCTGYIPRIGHNNEQ